MSRSATSTVEENTNLDFDIRFSNNISYLEIPLILKRQLTFGRLEINAHAGLVNRFLVQKSFDFEGIFLEDVRFQSRPRVFREQANAKQKPKAYTINYLVGIGLAYQIRPKTKIYVEPTFSRSIHPILKVGRASLFSQNQSINLGIRYTL